ncbi:hypothetical protein X975_00801, partial [Stegodyphus mimosarum]
MWISVAVSLAVVAIALLLRYIRKNDDYWKKRGVPYIPRDGIIGIIRNMIYKPVHEVVMEARKRGKIVGAFELRTPTLLIADPELARDVLVKDFHLFPNRRDDFVMGDPTFDNMVSGLRGETWKRVRTIITPAFTSKKMRKMSHIINDCAKTVLETFEKHAVSQEPVDCKKIFGAFTMDVIASSAFATKIDYHNDPNNIFVKNVKKVFGDFSGFRIFILFFLPKWLRIALGFRNVISGDFFRTVTLEVIKERKEKGYRHDDFLQLLMDAADEEIQDPEKASNAGFKTIDANDDEADQFGSVTTKGISTSLKYTNISRDELIAQCVLFFFVGYETTASTLTFMAYCLASNPDCQEKLIQEVDDAFKKYGHVDHDVTRDMKYLDYVISETLRMYPILTLTERTGITDYKLGNTGITVEKGIRVAFLVYAMHYDPEFFPEPERFNPERWVKDDSGKLSHPQYAYLPFGAGPRNCLGMRFALMEIKVCIANILRHYRFRKAKTTKEPLPFIPGYPFLSLKELPLLIEKRTDLNTPTAS